MERYKVATLADIEEIEKVPFNERIKLTNTYDIIKQGVSINPDAPAISLILSGDNYPSPIQVNYRELWGKINQTANLFYDLGVGPGDVVSFLLPNLHYTHYIIWGAEAAGIVNPINPLLEPAVIRDMCQSARTKVLVAFGDPRTDIWQKVMMIRNELPELKAIVRIMGPSEEKEGIYGYDEVITRYSDDKLDSRRIIDPQDAASIYGTAGTTGKAKLPVRTHFNEAAIIKILQIISAELNAGDAMLNGLPMFHGNATVGTGLFAFSIGGHVIIPSPSGYRDPSILKNFYKIVEHYRIATFTCVPTVLSVLLDIPNKDVDLSSLRYANCGAAPLSVDVFKRFEASCGVKIVEGYGLTEGTLCSTLNPLYGERKIGSVGMRIPYQELKIVVEQQDGFRGAETDEIGCVYIKGPNIFKGYLEEEHNQGIWLEDGWLNTGDMGRIDADGYLWLTGRKKELIIRGGHNIDPAIIEEPLYRFPGVVFAAAVGRPDSYAGEIPVAYVQMQKGFSNTADEILEYLKIEVGEKAAIPKEVTILKEIPLTPVGKIFKPALRWDATKKVYEKDLESLGNLVDSVEIKVAEDKVFGSLATVSIKPAVGVAESLIAEKVNEILGQYTVRYQLEVI